MRTIALVGSLIASMAIGGADVRADIYLIDLNTAQASGGYPDTSVWNIFSAPASVTGALTNNAGSSAAGISISIKAGSVITDSGANGSATYNTSVGGPAWVSGPSPHTNTQAAGDYFFTANNGLVRDSFTIVFSGLTLGDSVSLDLWASRQTGQNGNGLYSYSLDGGASSNGFFVLEQNGTATSDAYWTGNNTMTTTFRVGTDAYDNGRYMNISDVVLSGSTLEVTVLDDPSDPFSVLSAMRLEVTAVPEPSSVAMLILGSMGLITWRRRSLQSLA